MAYSNKEVYEKSNAIESVHYKKLSKKEYGRLIESKSTSERARNSKALLDYLCEKYGIPKVKFSLVDKNITKYCGVYVTKGICSYAIDREIKVWNRTKVKGNVVAINTYAETLLHEFIHHYDRCYLKLDETPHTVGFYKRITDLKNKLK